MFEQYVIDNNVTENTQLSFISQREHDESAGGDAFDVAGDFVFIDNDWTLE